SSRSRHTRFSRDWSSDVCSSDLILGMRVGEVLHEIVLLPPVDDLVQHLADAHPEDGHDLAVDERIELLEDGAYDEEQLEAPRQQSGRASCRARVQTDEGAAAAGR